MKKIEMIENLLNSETFMEAASGIQTLEQLQKLFAQNGVELTMEELKALTASAGAEANGELSDEELDNVAGGGFISWLFDKLKKKNTRDLEKLWK